MAATPERIEPIGSNIPKSAIEPSAFKVNSLVGEFGFNPDMNKINKATENIANKTTNQVFISLDTSFLFYNFAFLEMSYLSIIMLMLIFYREISNWFWKREITG